MSAQSNLFCSTQDTHIKKEAILRILIDWNGIRTESSELRESCILFSRPLSFFCMSALFSFFYSCLFYSLLYVFSACSKIMSTHDFGSPCHQSHHFYFLLHSSQFQPPLFLNLNSREKNLISLNCYFVYLFLSQTNRWWSLTSLCTVCFGVK